MPRRPMKRGLSPESERLAERLSEEFRSPAPSGRPLILEEGGGREPVHLYVVWDEWADLPQIERSEIVLEAYQRVEGSEKAIEVTVAMGVTEREARDMRLPVEV